MDNLNKLETELLKAIIDQNKERYPYLTFPFEILKVKSRKYTGVGSYTHFEYSPPIIGSTKYAPISSQKRLMIKGLENQLSYELNITDGKIDFLEIVTNGNDEWDGNDENFELV